MYLKQLAMSIHNVTQLYTTYRLQKQRYVRAVGSLASWLNRFRGNGFITATRCTFGSKYDSNWSVDRTQSRYQSQELIQRLKIASRNRTISSFGQQADEIYGAPDSSKYLTPLYFSFSIVLTKKKDGLSTCLVVELLFLARNRYP